MSCVDTELLSVTSSPDNTHKHNVKHVVPQLFPHSICANEFENGFLNGSTAILQNQSVCITNAPERVCFPGSGLDAGCDIV